MLIHSDDREEQLRDGQVVTTILDAVPLVLEANGHPCGVCVTLHRGVGIGNGREGFGLIVTRVDSHLDDLCAQLGYAVSDLIWRTSALTAPEEVMAPSSTGGQDNTAVNDLAAGENATHLSDANSPVMDVRSKLHCMYSPMDSHAQAPIQGKRSETMTLHILCTHHQDDIIVGQMPDKGRGVFAQRAFSPAAGVPIIPTHWLPRKEQVALSYLLDTLGWQQAVLKPTVSANADATVLIERRAPESVARGQAHLDHFLIWAHSHGEEECYVSCMHRMRQFPITVFRRSVTPGGQPVFAYARTDERSI